MDVNRYPRQAESLKYTEHTVDADGTTDVVFGAGEHMLAIKLMFASNTENRSYPILIPRIMLPGIGDAAEQVCTDSNNPPQPTGGRDPSVNIVRSGADQWTVSVHEVSTAGANEGLTSIAGIWTY